MWVWKIGFNSEFWKCTLFARSNVHDLQDKDLLGVGDTIALEAKYHPWHLVSLYNKAAALQIEDKHDKSDKLSRT